MARRSTRPRARLALVWLSLGLTAALTSAEVGASSDSPRRHGASGMLEPHTGPLLVDYYEAFLRDHDIEAFRRQVTSRYLEGTLARLLDAPDLPSRRAAVLALGLSGSFRVNGAVARCLKDADPTVRSLAENALWAIWFRGDTPENNATLGRVGALIGRQQYEEAVRLATRLIEQAPQFAEARNQRAIAEYFLGRFEQSAKDCRAAVERNPYHVGALAGLAKCQLRLGQRVPAIETLRRSSKLQPYNTDLKQWIAALESEGP